MRLAIIGIVLLFLAAPMMLIVNVSEVAQGEQSQPDGGGYVFTDGLAPEPTIEAEYYDVKNDPNAIGLDTSSSNALIKKDLGFNFKYYGNTYSSIYISTRGAMSFVETSGSAFTNYYNYKIPSSASPRGLMAVYWSWDYCYTRDKDRLFVLYSDIDGEKVFMVEWNTQQGARFQAILYEGGMIKYQYSSGNSNPLGSYVTIGIESPDGSTGTPYIDYSYSQTGKFNVPFAVAFTREDMQVQDISLVNGHGSGDQIYAGSRPYIFSVDVYHSRSVDDLLSCKLILGSLYTQERITILYFHGNQTFIQLTGFKYAVLLPDSSDILERNTNQITIEFGVDFKIEYPSEERRNVSAVARGRSAIPSVIDGGGLYKVENDLEWDSRDLRVKKVSGETSILKNDDFIGGGESIMFTNFRVYYERSDVQPPPTIISINISDNFGLKKVSYIPQGESLSTTWTVVDDTAIMTFDFEVAGLSYKNLLSDPFSFTLKVDTNPPGEVDIQSVEIYQDDLYGSSEPFDEDLGIYYDNDDSFFMKWDKITDGESGIVGYFVEVENNDFYLRKYVRNEDDESSNVTVFIGEDIDEIIPEGTFNVNIQARDLVGNLGSRITRTYINDRTGPKYELLDPLPGEWTTTKKPKLTFRVFDDLSPVDGRTLFYKVSTNGGITYSDESSMLYYGWDKKSVDIEISPNLVEGKSNMIKIQGEDLARSGISTSKEFPIWVDQRAPSISMIEPEVDDNLTSIQWIKDLSRPIKISMHDWKGSGIDPTRMSYRVSLNGGKNFSADIPLDGTPVNNSKGFSEYIFNIYKDDWLEGADNIMVIEAYDLVGRITSREFRIRVDMTPEVEIISPGINMEHYDNQTVVFNVDINDPDGEEDIEVTWMSNIDGPIGFEIRTETIISAGEHIITLTVEDGVHTLKRSIPVKVLSSRLLDPAFRDSDFDGMNDSYEEAYGLDPFVKDGDDDLDGDGFTNLQEYYAQTDPTLASDHPGSELVSSSISSNAIIMIVVGFILLIAFGSLFIRESRKQTQPPELPPYYLNQQTNLPPTGQTAYQPPALPPARDQVQ